MLVGLERSCPNVLRVLLFSVIAVGILCGPVRGQPCASDCDGNGNVDVSELVFALNVALGLADGSDCRAADLNGDGEVTIEELVEAVDRSMSGCVFRLGREAVESAVRVQQMAQTTLPTFTFGFGDISSGSASSFLVARRDREAAADLPAVFDGGAAGQPVPLPCSGEGTIVRTCDRNSSTLTTTYAECRFAGSEVVRNGTEKQTVVVADDPGFDFCDNPDVSPPQDATVTVVLQEYSEISPSRGIRLANLSQTFEPAPVEPCMSGKEVFQSGTFSLNGFLHVFCDPEVVATCDETLAELRLTARDLVLEQTYESPVCDLTTRAHGGLTVDNVSTGEESTQNFLDLMITESIVGDRRIMSQNGRVLVNCLGEVEYSTAEDLSVASGEFCASSGELRIAIRDPSEVASEAALPADGAAAQAVGSEPNSTAASGGLVDLAYRAANGQVYQVLQNPEGNPELQTEDVRITTAVGSTSGISECSTIETVVPRAQAVVSAPSGLAFPLSKAFVSTFVGSTTQPCFNPNGRLGDGLLCLGEGCNSNDCRCLRSGFCLEMSLADVESAGNGAKLTPLAESMLEGHLVGSLGSLAAPCSGAQGRSAYRFGAGGPTLDVDLCVARPQDGFSLQPDSSIVFAYDAPPTSEFFTGAGGFPIDEFGDSQRCPETPGSVVTGVATKNELGRARVAFRNGRVNFDVNDDSSVERSLPSCQLLTAAALCTAPSPTPSPPPNRPCPEFRNGVQPEGSTSAASAFNVLTGASCGDGGNSAPERTYLFQAEADGCYRIDTFGSSFDTLLYVRRGDSCDGPEIACNDNADSSTLDSQIFLQFERGNPDLGDTAVVVVDGNAGEKGAFQLHAEQVPIGNCDEGGPIQGPVAPDVVGAACNVTGNPCMAGGATVTCTGLNPASFRDLYYGIRNDRTVSGETMAGTSGPAPSSTSVYRHSTGEGTVITYLGNSNPAATTIYDANGHPNSPVGDQQVATRLLLTVTSGTASAIPTAGVPADNANGDVGSLFRVTSTSFSVRIEAQARDSASSVFDTSCTTLFNPTHTRSAGSLFGTVDQDISSVDLGFYFRNLPEEDRSISAADTRRQDSPAGAAASARLRTSENVAGSSTVRTNGVAGVGMGGTSGVDHGETQLAPGAEQAGGRALVTTATPSPSPTSTPTETPTPGPALL